jgi:hypothetical protein
VSQFETAIEKGLLLVIDFNSEIEEETFVNYVFELGDDGESATGAIAFHRDWAIATDDKKAISFFPKRIAPSANPINFSNSQKLVREREASSTTLRSVLSAIRTRGRYMPHRNHPLFRWWEDVMR